MKAVIASGAVLACLAGIGIGIPRVLGEQASRPAVAAADAQAEWPAAKAAAMAAENRLREDAVGRPVIAPAGTGLASARAAGARLDSTRSVRTQPVRAASGGAGKDGGAGAAGRRTPARTHPQPAAAAPRAAYTAGILPLTDGGPFSSWRFVGTNLWNGAVSGRWEVVQAGGTPAHRALGAASADRAGLFVYTESTDPGTTAGRRTAGVFAPSPDPGGTFTVAKAAGGTLTLTLTGSRKRYFFDVATRTFTR